jgi:cell division septum initiation protein DivIVA
MPAKQTKNGAPPINAAFEQVQDYNDQFLATARKAGNMYLDAYEQVVERAIELERKVGDVTQQEWLKSLIEAQTDFAQEVSEAYTKAARDLLK